ncbi:MAG TPA: BlaI/MecI/CopY family transcriptional regulator [Gemmatimonadaceae bacterium]|nr:BlaI/MecI/CopY family transcriptional regulator [Gemmatimonadaceae bacterium]
MSEYPPDIELGRRERQIMDVVYRLGRASCAEVLAQLPDPPSYSAVRGMLRLLEEKGYLRHEEEGPRYVYLPMVPREDASRSALQHLVRTFFGGSRTRLMAALLDLPDTELSDEQLEELKRLADHARRQGR